MPSSKKPVSSEQVEGAKHVHNLLGENVMEPNFGAGFEGDIRIFGNGLQ